ncbi:DMT family transporter [Kushneria aurantia]|uniref:DMT family transporter n=1 Tax=Kushneria aurantia TaxID=504092 RepID=A0ABV6G4N5_9GAMM|nr:DMT family transporter [Kushneria aurantia]
MFQQKHFSSAVTGGVLTILATVFAMALADAIVKYASTDMTLWQIYVLRSLAVVPVLALLACGRVRVPGLGWILLRSLALSLMYLGIYAALPLLDLSVVAASLYTAPLFITLLAAIFLRDPINPGHWVAMFMGFLGVVLIVKPGGIGFTPFALLPVSAALLYAIAAVLTRAKCQLTPAPVLGFWLNVTLLAMGTTISCAIVSTQGADNVYPFLLGNWSRMSARNWMVIATLATLMVGISIGLAKAYQSPRPHVIAAFDYAFLIFAALWGFVFFGEVPDGWTLLGMTLIAVAGMLALRANAVAEKVRGSGEMQ